MMRACHCAATSRTPAAVHALPVTPLWRTRARRRATAESSGGAAAAGAASASLAGRATPRRPFAPVAASAWDNASAWVATGGGSTTSTTAEDDSDDEDNDPTILTPRLPQPLPPPPEGVARALAPSSGAPAVPLRARFSAESLAFLGDAVWEVYVRGALVQDALERGDAVVAAAAKEEEAKGSSRNAAVARRRRALRLAAMDAARQRVNAKAQAAAHDAVAAAVSGGAKRETEGQQRPKDEDDEEQNERRVFLRWAANTGPSASGPPSGTSAGEYRRATALEALAGALFLTDQPALHALMRRALEGGGHVYESPEAAKAGLAAAAGRKRRDGRRRIEK